MIKKSYDLKQLLGWVSEAQTTHQGWRRESWEDYEFRDGKQWSAAAISKMKQKGIKALTINRIFPIMNLIMGHFINNQQDVVAKGRTKKDNELGQVMSEGISFVRDQNKGSQRIVKAFGDMITTGFGCMGVGLNSDPRLEPITLKSYPWYSIWWDPYASPWMDKSDCRYAFYAGWKDLADVMAFFPDKAKDIEEQFKHLTTDDFVPDVYDEGTMIEDHKRYLGSGHWVNHERKRVRPVEMWYSVVVKSWFAIMPDGRVLDLDQVGDPRAQFSIIQQAHEVVSANVKRMRVATFLSNLMLRDIPTPFAHDNFPYVPFVGYLDRFDQPFGIPRQIKEQDMEVNKRRSMALSLISNRRVILEKGSAEDVNKVYDEANRQDGFIVLKNGKKGTFEIQEMGQLAAAQIELMKQSEAEIQEISGANDESLGYETKVQSGVALERKQQTQATITASLLENARYAMKDMGEKIASLMQNTWTEEKVLRVVDRVTGVEKFVAINEPIVGLGGEVIEVRNDITQARFDLVVATKPMTDTMREKNMELIFSAINKSPAEAVGPLLNLALEISDIPNKDLLLKQVRAATGVDTIDDDLTMEEREAKEQAEAAENQARQEEEYQLGVEDRRIDQAERVAKAEKLRAEALAILQNADTAAEKVKQDGFKMGQELINDLLDGGDSADKQSGKASPGMERGKQRTRTSTEAPRV